MSYIIWMHPRDCDPPHGLDMESEHDRKKVQWLYDQFIKKGFDLDFPAMVGYPKDGRIQLVSGTHRHRAALSADMMIPVTLWLSSYIDRAWGTDYWLDILKDIPVKDLVTLKTEEDLWHMLQQFEPVDIDY